MYEEWRTLRSVTGIGGNSSAEKVTNSQELACRQLIAERGWAPLPIYVDPDHPTRWRRHATHP